MIFRLFLIGLFLGTMSCSNKDFVGTTINKIAGNTGLGSGAEPSPSPGTTPPPPPGSGLDNGKVFNKNPLFAGAPSAYTITQGGSGYSISPTTPINFDSYLTTVSITGTTNTYLENATLKVLTDTATSFGAGGLPVIQPSSVKRAQADASGNWFFSSVGDADHKLGQLMAYYWINKMSDDLEAKVTGGSYFKSKATKVYSYCYNVNTARSPGLNAFWAGSLKYACMSYLGNFESAYDASVYVHEMGHGNIDYATNFAFATQTPTNQSGSRCLSADGCPGALNEGQADFHSELLFNSGPIGEFFLNNRGGLGGRDSSKNGNLTATQRFQQSSEIHSMGAVWSASWWTLRDRIGATDTDKIFLFSLSTMTPQATFRGALTRVLTAAQQLKGAGKIASDYKTEITQSFGQHGITPQ